MKKKIFTLSLAIMALAGIQLKAQIVIADFDKVNAVDSLFTVGNPAKVTSPTPHFQIVANPLKAGLDTSSKVLMIKHEETDKSWGDADWYGIYIPATFTVDTTTTLRYLHYKFLSQVKGAQVGAEPTNATDKDQIEGYAPLVVGNMVGKWVDVCVDLAKKGGEGKFHQNETWTSIYMCPNRTFDLDSAAKPIQTTYIDDIVINSNPKALFDSIHGPVYADFTNDTISIAWAVDNYVTGMDTTKSKHYSIVPNPYTDGLNLLSKTVLKITQTKVDASWGSVDWYGITLAPKNGAYTVIDTTLNQRYLHAYIYHETRESHVGFEFNGLNAAGVQTQVKGSWAGNLASNDVKKGVWTDVVDDLSKYVSGQNPFSIVKLTNISFYPDRSYQTDKMSAPEVTYLDKILFSNVAKAAVDSIHSPIFANFSVDNANDSLILAVNNTVVGMDTTPSSHFSIVANPHPTGLNGKLAKVLMVTQKKADASWGNTDWYGINITLGNGRYTNIDTTSKQRYIHAFVYHETRACKMGFQFNGYDATGAMVENKDNWGENLDSTLVPLKRWKDVVIDLSQPTGKFTIIRLTNVGYYADRRYTEDKAKGTEISYIDSIELSSSAAPRFVVPSDSNIVAVPHVSVAQVSIYPNPAINVINIKNAEGSTVKAFDITGQLCLSAINTNGTVDVSGLSKGVYILRLTTKNGESYTSKLIKR